MRRIKKSIDTVEVRRKTFGEGRDQHLLEHCDSLWENLRYFRERRARALRFTYGDQWGDRITVKGKTMTEKQYINSVGNLALQSNQIKKIVNTISGVWTTEQNEPICVARDTKEQQYGEIMTTTLQANWQRNKMKVLMINAIEDALIGGACFLRESWEMRGGDFDSWTDICNPNYIFFDSGMKDPRGWDLSLIGEIHDIDFNELCSKFCASPEEYQKLKEWYTAAASPLKGETSKDITETNELGLINFFTPYDNDKCRVFEIWTKEARGMWQVHDPNEGELYIVKDSDTEMLAKIEQTNKERYELGMQMGWSKDEIPLITKQYFMQTYWYYRFITPSGYIISEGESPFDDMMHPYSICLMPFTDGKIVSYISDAIDHNIAINRALTLDDWMKRAGVKGVSYIPVDCVPTGMTNEEFAEQWTSIDGIIFYKPKPGMPEPKQFYSNIGHLNTTEIVRLMSDLLETSVAGVGGAIQGKTPHAGTSAALYAQQTQNASKPIATFMTRFESFVNDSATRKLKMIQQYYPQEKYEMIAGKIDEQALADIDVDKTGNVDYDLSIVQSTETPVYRMIANEQLIDFWRSGAVALRDALDLSSLPYKDKLIQKMDAREQADPGNMQQQIQDVGPQRGQQRQLQPLTPEMM